MDSFKNEGASKDAFKYHTAELQDLCVTGSSQISRKDAQLSLWTTCMYMLPSFSTG